MPVNKCTCGNYLKVRLLENKKCLVPPHFDSDINIWKISSHSKKIKKLKNNKIKLPLKQEEQANRVVKC
jgi:hypothetical protein